MVEGKLIGFNVDGSWIPCETNCSLSFENEHFNKNNKVSGEWRSYLEGYKKWTMNVSGVYTKDSGSASIGAIITKNILVGQEFEVIWGTKDINDPLILKGFALIKNLDADAPSEGYATYNISFIGQGALTEVDLV